MSLINDALKRAKQAQKRHAPPVAPALPMRPGQAKLQSSSTSGLVWLVAGALVLGLVAVTVIFVAAHASAAKDRELAARVPEAASIPLPASIAPRSAPVPQPAPPSGAAVAPGTKVNPMPATPAPGPQLVPSPQSLVQPLTSPGAVALNPAVVPTNSTPTVASTRPAAAPPSALPKLQGIFYRRERSSAVVNGKTVMVGSMVGEYLVAAIDQKSVTLVSASRTNVLSLEE